MRALFQILIGVATHEHRAEHDEHASQNSDQSRPASR